MQQTPRLSFDPARHYTGVLPQQGRVTMEAEENEARDIAAEQRRHEILEIVGPAGTPDNGYAVSSAGGYDLSIGPGTMYLGGQRVSLDAEVLYSAQPDWRDSPSDPDFTPVPTSEPGHNEHVVLVVTEYDVTATEDPVLREVALGGPDGAARTRLVQRVHRLPTDASTCLDASAQDEKLWGAQGLSMDSRTLRLQSASRLQVSWEGAALPPDPCEPASTGGYLGAENQVIRVQIVAVDPQTGQFDLLWGYDNASMHYRVTPDGSKNPILTLSRSPVDEYHRPRAGQAVQVLPSAADLSVPDPVVEGWAAALTGPAAVLTAPYDPDTKTLQFPDPLPGPFTDPIATPQLYLRVWEELRTGNKIGDDITLTGTGLRVRLTVDSAGPLHVGDVWCIGVRPSIPTEVLPARLLHSPQPPDGSRSWVCPLAVIGWDDGQLRIIEDCRRPFHPLVDIDVGMAGCCTVSVTASDTELLQTIIDAAVAGRSLKDRSQRITICLRPGRYELTKPLVLSHQHSNVHLEGCSEGAVLAVHPGSEKAFASGLIVLVHADNVSISGLEFELPQVPVPGSFIKKLRGELRAIATPLAAIYQGLFVSLGIRSIHCAVLEIERCLFRFTVGPANSVGNDVPRNVFGVGIFAASECWGLRLERNRFLHHSPAQADDERGGERQILVGLLLGTSVAPSFPGLSSRGAANLPGAPVLRSLLTDAVVRDNLFTGLTTAVYVNAELGDIRIDDNTVRNCYSGFYLYAQDTQSSVDLTRHYPLPGVPTATADALRAAVAAGIVDRTLLLISVLARTYPLPDPVDAAQLGEMLRAGSKAAPIDQQKWMSEFVAQLVASFATGDESEAPGPPASLTEAASREEFLSSPSAEDVHLRTVHLALSVLEREAAREPFVQEPQLRCVDNEVDCAVAGDAQAGPALLLWVWNATVQTQPIIASAIVAANRFTSRNPDVVVDILLLFVGEAGCRATVTGNIVLNSLGATSLSLAAKGAIAVTGNVLRGKVVLPGSRPFQPPLDTWLPLNTVTS